MTKSANQFLPYAYLRGKIVPFEEANVSIATHALHYGTAAFGGMRAEPDPKKSGKVVLFRPELHFERLANSAKLLSYDSPNGPLTAEKITKVVKEFIAANPCDKPYYIRPLVYVSDLGIAPRLHNVEYDILVYGLKMGEYLSKDGVTCCFSSWTRGEDRSLPLRGKISGTYVTSALAKTEAIQRGFDEAIFLNSRGKIAEGSAMNIFMVREGALITPPVTEDILEGITRRSILELAKHLGIPVEERQIDHSELLIADEVFLTGTAARLTPIKKIEQYELPNKRPITDKLTKAFQQVTNRELPDFEDWLVSVPGDNKA
jgi:branched-chain amino acid aminotransferase